MVASSFPRYPGDIAGTFVASLAQALRARGHEIVVLAPWDVEVVRDDSKVFKNPLSLSLPTGQAGLSKAERRGSTSRSTLPTGQAGSMSSPRAANHAVKQSHDPAGVPVKWFGYSPLASIQPMGYGKALENDQRLRWSAVLCAPGYLVSGTANLLRLIRELRIDVIHAHWLLPNGPVGLLASKMSGRPLVITLHGSDTYLAKRNRGLRWLGRRCVEGASVVTACSPDLAEDALSLGARKGSVRVIPWGADPNRFGHGDPSVWRRRLDIPSERPVIVAVGRMVAKKGFSFLVDAFAKVSAIHQDAVLVIGGDGPERDGLIARAAAKGLAGRVHFPGRIPWEAMPDFLAMADVVAVPSVRDSEGNQDGLPTVALEAMAAGKPLVASDLAGLPMVVEHGVTGMLAPSGDAGALAAALIDLLGNPSLRCAFGRAARRRVEETLNWDAVARAYEAVYREALA